MIDPRIDTCPEDVAGGLVQGARLVRILEPGGKLRNAVREFMAGNVNVLGEVLKDVAVAVAEYHPSTIPKCIVEIYAVIYVGIQIETQVVD